jgi:hypothetical protein
VFFINNCCLKHNHSKRNWARNHKCTRLHVKNPPFFGWIFEKYPNIKFYANPSNGTRIISCGRAGRRTDGNVADNSRFSQFRERAKKPDQFVNIKFPVKLKQTANEIFNSSCMVYGEGGRVKATQNCFKRYYDAWRIWSGVQLPMATTLNGIVYRWN